jgi:hypothetical protein
VKFDLHTHETIVLILGALGLVEQELVRLLFSLEPSQTISNLCGGMILASLGAGFVRGSRRNGNGSS